jgi:ABC-type uncharacterized transport system substrate-binding protein
MVKSVQGVKPTASAHGLEVVTLKIRRSEEIAPAFEAVKGRADALYRLAESCNIGVARQAHEYADIGAR